MASYPEYLAATFGDFPCHDDAWPVSSGMERSDSQSTSCTVDSTYTTGSHSTSYSSTGATSIEDNDYYGEPASSLYAFGGYSEPQAADHLLSATGSQYQHAEQQIPQALQISTPLQIFDTIIPSIGEAARQATESAASLIFHQQQRFGRGGPPVISSGAIEDALLGSQAYGQEASRAAVQAVLHQQLWRQFNELDHFSTDTTSILEEAAYQLQLRLQGPRVFDICLCAIAAILTKLRVDLERSYPEVIAGPEDPHSAKPQPAEPPTEKERYPCLIPGCEQKAFSRSADLDRHYKMKHVDDDQKKKFKCDYRKCNRHRAPFFRQDHFRDHLRVYHKEDLLRRGNSGDLEWWKSRSNRALFEGWWRCNRCLAVRVDYATHGFVCPGCGSPCEAARQKYRLSIAAAR